MRHLINRIRYIIESRLHGGDAPPHLCEDCEDLVAEAVQWRDWQSLDIGVHCDKHEPT